jgi:hypothetical protein
LPLRALLDDQWPYSRAQGRIGKEIADLFKLSRLDTLVGERAVEGLCSAVLTK